jgi:hypothetical protein
MKKFFFLFLLIFLSHSFIFKSFGQSYQSLVDTNKTWSVLFNMDMPPWNTTYTIKLGEDTLINSHNYKKVFRSDEENTINWYGYGFLREDSLKKIYWLNSGTDSLLYDFDLHINDIYIYDYYSWKLISIDSISLNNSYKKRYNFKFIIDTTLFDINETWIEGIGSLSGLFTIGRSTTTGGSYLLLCFSEKDTLIYQNPNYSVCYLGNTDIPSYNNKSDIKLAVFSNSHILKIEYNTDYYRAVFQIIDISGREINSFKLNGNTKKDIYIKNNGIYFYKFICDKEIRTGKFIIE